ncbi:ribonuclease H-like domain-containing protein [Tanacetum coccineum]
MDTSTSSHLNNSVNSLSEIFNLCMYPSISVGDGDSIPVTNTGHSILPTPLKSLHLNNVLITPHIVKNLISVRQFVRDNNCTIEFDAFGFSVKDFMTRRVLFQCDSMGDIYPVTAPSLIPHAFLLEGVDVDETFSPVVKSGTIRTVLSLDASRHRPIHQLDVKNAFSHGDLSEIVYMHQPPGFRDSVHPDYKKYDVEILDRAHMVNCNPSRTPIDTESKLGSDGDPVSDPTLYRSLAGSLQYLTFTRPDISYVVQKVCLYMHDPREPHFLAFKRILRYVRGTLDYGLQLFSSSTTDVVAYSDADWAGCLTTRRSTSGYCVFLGNNLLSWSSKRQPTLSRSSAEAEYRGVANAVADVGYTIYCHQRTKHIEIDIHFVRDLIAVGQVRVFHVPSRYQFADIFTKGLPSALFEEFRSSLSVRCPSAPIAREYRSKEGSVRDKGSWLKGVWCWEWDWGGILGVELAMISLKRRLPIRDELDKRGIESCAHCLVTCDLAMAVWDKVFCWWKMGCVNAFSVGEFFSSNGYINVPS